MFCSLTLPKLKPYEWSEFCLLMIISILIPISWDLATKGLILLFFHTLAKLFFQEKIGRFPIESSKKIGLGLLASYFLIYLISLTFTFNIGEGKEEVLGKLPFLLLPITFILSNTSYINKNLLRTIIYAFILAICIRFLVRLGITVSKCFGEEAKNFFNIKFDELHHTYLAMYILFSLLFLYWDFIRHGTRYPQWGKITTISIVFILIADLILIQSRTGILGLILIGIFIIAHLIIAQHKYRLGLATLLTAIATILIVSFCLPDKTHRLSKTLTEITTKKHNDDRFYTTKTAIETIGENPIYGVGAGDRIDVLFPHYQDAPFHNSLRNHKYNPHNMYLDTRLTVGLPGLLILLSILIFPIISPLKTAHKERKTLFLALISPIALSGLFESILERQMGIIFLCFFYCLIFSSQFEDTDILSSSNN